MKPIQARLDAFSQHEPNTGCQLWFGSSDANGYGRLKVGGRMRLAHRVSYAESKGDPAGLKVCHRCDTPACISPAHLWLGTQADNMRDMFRKGRDRQSRSDGEHNNRAKLTDAQVREIRALVAAGERPKTVAPRFGVTVDWVRRLTRPGAGMRVAA